MRLFNVPLQLLDSPCRALVVFVGKSGFDVHEVLVYSHPDDGALEAASLTCVNCHVGDGQLALDVVVDLLKGL